MRKNTPKKILTWLLIGLVGFGAVGYLSDGFKDFNYKDWFTTSNDEDNSVIDPDNVEVGYVDNGITLTPKFADSSTIGSVKSFTYSIDPFIHTGVITYSLTCSNVSIDPTDYYSVNLDTDNQEITITLLAICDYQCSLKLYAVDDPEVNAVVTLDYQQRISSVTSTLNVVEDSPLSISNAVVKTGGSISVSTAVTSSTFVFDSDFVTSVESKLDYLFMKSGITDPITTYTGLTNASYWLSTPYNSVDFLTSIGESRTGKNGVGRTITLAYTFMDLSESDLGELFDGNTDVFNYTAVVNSVNYTTDFGLTIDSIPITGINTSTSSIVF